MNSSKRHFVFYCLAVTAIWFFSHDILHQLLFFQGSYTIALMPFITFGLPNFIFFLCAAVVLALIMKRDFLKWGAMFTSLFLLVQAIYTVALAESVVSSWIGILFLSAPFVGIIFGVAIGMVSVYLAALRGARFSAAAGNSKGPGSH